MPDLLHPNSIMSRIVHIINPMLAAVVAGEILHVFEAHQKKQQVLARKLIGGEDVEAQMGR